MKKLIKFFVRLFIFALVVEIVLFVIFLIVDPGNSGNAGDNEPAVETVEETGAPDERAEGSTASSEADGEREAAGDSGMKDEGAAETAEVPSAADGGEAAVDEPEPRDTGTMLLLEANRPGAYGRTFTNYGGGSIYDTSEIMGWFVPAGPYTVTAIRTDGPRLAVWYGSIEPSINSDGVPETMDFECALLAEGESADIVVPRGGCVYIKGTQALIKLDSLG